MRCNNCRTSIVLRTANVPTRPCFELPIDGESGDYLVKDGNGAKWDRRTNVYIDLTLETFNALQSYTFSSQSLRIEVIADEDKNQSNTIYYWNGSKLWWSAEIIDQFQPTI